MSIRQIFIVAVVSLFTMPGSGWAQESSKPNVLFISIDDLNDWVGFLGGHPQVRTPNMDRLATRGVVFENAHCPAPLCCPSRAAIYSGRYPHETGVYKNSDQIRKKHPDLKLLPQHFSQAGYRVFGTGKLMHRYHRDLFDDSYKPEQRWSPFASSKVMEYTADELPSKGTNQPKHVIHNGPGGRTYVVPINRMPSDRAPNDPKGESFDWAGFDLDDSEFGDTKITDWAIEKIKDDSNKPFFLAVGYYRPHIPLYAPKKYFDLYPLESIVLPPVRAGDLDDLGPTGKRWAMEAVTAGSHATVISHSQWKQAVQAYLACVSFVDAQIGRLLAALEQSNQAANTHVMLWSDHGWHLGEKQHWGKWTGWDRSTRVPLIVAPAKNHQSRFKIGATCSQPVNLVDLYPTLVQICGLERPEGLSGQSLEPLLRAPTAALRGSTLSIFDQGNYSLRTTDFRLIQYADGTREFYHLKMDPNEWTNLAGRTEYASLITRLAQFLPDTK